MRKRNFHVLLAAAGLLASVAGCVLFDLVGGAEFSLVGARVALMPFAGPGNWWYGENPLARHIYGKVAAMLREGGVEVCISRRINQELLNYLEDREPPWVQYGKRLKADYVVVGRLVDWELGRPTAVAFVPGKAVMDVSVYDVAQERLVFQRRIAASVGLEEDSTDLYAGSDQARYVLVKRVLQKWRSLFIEKSAFD